MLFDIDNAKSLAQKLLQIESVVLNVQQPFTWTSGLKAPIYCDNRLVLSYPSLRTNIKNQFVQIAQGMKPEITAIAGVATAGIPHAALVAEAMGLPMVYVRTSAKKHGRENQIEGALDPGHRVLLIEDLISTGSSSLSALEALQANHHQVCGLAAIFTYNLPKATQAFQAYDVPVYTLTDYATLTKVALDMGYVNNGALETLENWRANPEAWGNP